MVWSVPRDMFGETVGPKVLSDRFQYNLLEGPFGMPAELTRMRVVAKRHTFLQGETPALVIT